MLNNVVESSRSKWKWWSRFFKQISAYLLGEGLSTPYCGLGENGDNPTDYSQVQKRRDFSIVISRDSFSSAEYDFGSDGFGEGGILFLLRDGWLMVDEHCHQWFTSPDSL